jgi:glyoxylase-like metal-dependent hydrolase (beta-lactamase superfamily II)
MNASFASSGDTTERTISFTELAPGAYAYTAEGDPNSGVVVGDDAVMVIDATATPLMAQDLIARIRKVTDKPVRYVVLTHYHAVRVMGASAFDADEIIASRTTYDLIVERGQQDFDSEVGRFPRLFRAVESVPGLTWPTMAFGDSLTVWLGKRRVDLMHLGRGHTAGDIIAWLPDEKVCFSGDLVEYGATPYTGDAHLRDWPSTLDRVAAFGAERLVPGRGEALTEAAQVAEGLEQTRAFVTALYGSVAASVAAGHDLKAAYDAAYAALEPRFGQWVIFEHCMPFDVSRAFDEASGIEHPRIWTAERDREMWAQLRG